MNFSYFFVDPSVSCLSNTWKRQFAGYSCKALQGYANEMRVLTPPSTSQLVTAIVFLANKLYPPEPWATVGNEKNPVLVEL